MEEGRWLVISFAFHDELASEIAGSLGFMEILKILELKKLH